MRVYAVEPLEVRLPGARSLVVIERATTFAADEVPTVAYYLTSHPPGPGCARRFAGLVRGHWGGCESRNHWARDASMREDRTRCKDYNVNCNLAALRVGLLALKAQHHPDRSWPNLQECCQANPGIPFQILVKHRPK